METAKTQTNRTVLRQLLFSCFALLLLPVTANAWWNGDWSLRKKITLDATTAGGDITEPIGTATVLIRLHDGNFQFASAQDNGTDIRFVADDDKTPLACQIEKYDSLLNEAFVWVKIPDLKSGAKTSFWLYYGNSKAPKSDIPKGVFDGDTALVYHFSEHGQAPIDSSGVGNNAANAGVPVGGSLIGTGIRFDGQGGINIPASPSLALSGGSAFTLSAWIKPAVAQPNAIIYSRHDGANALLIGIDNGVPFVELTNAGSTQRSQPGAALPVNSWHHLAAVADASRITLFVDGASFAAVNGALPALNSPALIGGDTTPGATGFQGEVDELQISKVARSPGFLKLASSSQGGNGVDKLLVLGQDEETASFIGGYFGVILKSVTPDGWVVIGILMVMALVSWFVMANRVVYLNKVSKGNARFLQEWRHVAADLTVLNHDDAEKFKSLGGRVKSTGSNLVTQAAIYRIYHIGAEEIRHRLTNKSGSKVLSAAAIESIRASLDGGLVRETQKLNRLMVFLTLSISGGPFLGLLGTVIGVMITFAAIAAAGDVNVNSIAPGIAAALVATVAGLAVAIPALFGYNYLLTRIKDVTNDLRVFIDEFVTKVAEFYCTPVE
jgi:biopolymer transport protein ExbB